jgi:hypothetical protein
VCERKEKGLREEIFPTIKGNRSRRGNMELRMLIENEEEAAYFAKM